MTTMINSKCTLEAAARDDYDNALRKAAWRGIRTALKRGCNDLLPTSTVLEQLDLHNQRQLGLQHVPLDKIVGSTGRYRDFDLTFLPRRRETDGRWLRIARARREGVSLPPPRLYKIGEVYFVEDGNHRISVARAAAQGHILACVTELDA